MAISSMTGYGRSEGAFEERTWYWELRSVNGRGLDLKFRLPPGFDKVEQICRKRAQSVLGRGNVQCNLMITVSDGKPSFQINQAALEQALSYLQIVAQRVDTAPSSGTSILAMPGVLERFSEEPSTEDQESLHEALNTSFEDALAALTKAREAEGEHLRVIVAGLLQQIADLVQLATDNPARTPRAIQDRIKKQIALLSGGQTRLDEERLHQEAMLLATKADIQEELDRLRAHIVAAGDLLLAGQPVGRKFDFLTQEFNREANTLCSKSNDPSLTKTGLALKAVVDQLREQIQNIE
tara:strand:- start:13315 stop:14202 length:888 start_codon:yes stop_codon:yes gene_type:complete